ncbi:ABC-F family ATP-binding cassette domain-containing protein [Streptomyces sp. NL15-2K]|uniref:ABC-F family ATP-binding cassette domain-containing protein n=1 Tax=Streptomyces sp. NL15-2K TaxID=376149 RepID=UPI000F57DCB5|nr:MULTISPECIES: ATP-binding cassette domain-containing protein [Actinomycetes]WKX13319.1 ATP-binding cassette domain-containing protein [Kutzneria buriramensis]GCB45313.1 ABC transporter ATP-binding protein [Streptomyces sp. NL15-2K]
MGHIEVDRLTYLLPDGRLLLNEVSFRIGDGSKAGLVGPNGAGKTTLLRLIAGDVRPDDGRVVQSGGLGVMRQFIGSVRDGRTLHDLLLSVAPDRVRVAAAGLVAAESALVERDEEQTQLAYAQAITDYSDAGGYDMEVVWDTCATAALGLSYDEVRHRPVNTLSGGEQKRTVLEALLRGPDQVLLLDEPDNYLDVPGKQWLEEQLRATGKTVLLVSHDRQLLANAADRIVTVESRGAWVHGGGFDSYAQGRRDRIARLEERRRRWDEEHARLKHLVHSLRQTATNNDSVASAYRAARTRLSRFEEAGPPERPPKEQNVRMRLRGGRTGKRAVICDSLELTGLMRPFDTEIWYGERVGVLGSNGSGKSHFLRLLAEAADGAVPSLRHTGSVRLGARVVPGHFVQTHTRPDLHGRTPAELVTSHHSLTLNEAMAALARYELAPAGSQLFETLSGGQQARLQILLLELSGATLLLLDEPTDNLDLASAEALQQGLAAFSGTVLAVTHDRWFAADFDRFLIFGADGTVYESAEPVWDEGRVDRDGPRRHHREAGHDQPGPMY